MSRGIVLVMGALIVLSLFSLGYHHHPYCHCLYCQIVVILLCCCCPCCFAGLLIAVWWGVWVSIKVWYVAVWMGLCVW